MDLNAAKSSGEGRHTHTSYHSTLLTNHFQTDSILRLSTCNFPLFFDGFSRDRLCVDLNMFMAQFLTTTALFVSVKEQAHTH